MFYYCDSCDKKYRFTLEDMECKNFGNCPICGQKGKLQAESKDRPDNHDQFQIVYGD
jgi:rRNA maturation endonuclease Nob1